MTISTIRGIKFTFTDHMVYGTWVIIIAWVAVLFFNFSWINFLGVIVLTLVHRFIYLDYIANIRIGRQSRKENSKRK